MMSRREDTKFFVALPSGMSLPSAFRFILRRKRRQCVNVLFAFPSNHVSLFLM